MIYIVLIMENVQFQLSADNEIIVINTKTQ